MGKATATGPFRAAATFDSRFLILITGVSRGRNWAPWVIPGRPMGGPASFFRQKNLVAFLTVKKSHN
jgi:hypothetical protein